MKECRSDELQREKCFKAKPQTLVHIIVPSFIISTFFCQTRCSTDVEWCIQTSADLKEPRYHGYQVLSTVKEVKTYNGNISIAQTVAIVSHLHWSWKEKENKRKRKSWEEKESKNFRRWKRRSWKGRKGLIAKEN